MLNVAPESYLRNPMVKLSDVAALLLQEARTLNPLPYDTCQEAHDAVALCSPHVACDRATIPVLAA